MFGNIVGGVASPLLANVYMHRFLRYWEQEGKGSQFQAKVINYADDFVILSRGHAEEALFRGTPYVFRSSFQAFGQVCGVSEEAISQKAGTDR